MDSAKSNKAASRRVRFTRLAGAAVVVAIVLGVWWVWNYRHHWVARHFRVVEPGRIYASGYQYPGPLRRIVRKHAIKTVLSLRAADELEDVEREVLTGEGVAFRRVVIPDRVPDAERIQKIQEAIAIMTDPANQPALVHCFAGCHRSGTVVAIYRVSRCGWPEARAHAELVRYGGTSRNARAPARVLHTFCEQLRLDVARGQGGTSAF
jgi:predicted protein tyrosine phosphatase